MNAIRFSMALAVSVLAPAALAQPRTTPAPPADPTARLLDRLREFAATQAPGFAPVDAPQSAVLEQSGVREYALNAEAGVCYRFIAVGGEGVSDVDIAVYRGTERIAQDTAVGDVPVARWCPTEAADVRVRVILYRGAGRFMYQAFRGAPDPPARQTDAASSQVAPGDDYVAVQLRALYARLGQGRRPVAGIERGRLRTSEARSHAVALEDGRCYTVLAIGVPSVHDIELALLDPNGSQVAQDDTHESSARVTYCATVPGTYQANVRMFAGYGAYGLQAFGE